MLAEKTKAGELPDVDARLPVTPVLVQPVKSIGHYGGTWRMAMRRGRDHALLIRTIGYENLIRWNPEWTGIVPNIAQSYTVNDNATVYTFKLREGIRWSDGAPFTADDILFWYNDVLLNKDLTEGLDAWRISNGKKFEVEKLGKYEVAFRFDEPQGMFLEYLAAPEGAEATSYPAHYLKPYHIDYNPDANSKARAAGFKDWTQQFYDVFGKPGTIDDKSRWLNPDLPVLNAWLLKGTYTVDEPLEAVRNPYYWKVDPAGQQLPYIDRISYEVVESKADARQVAREGRVDMQVRHMNVFAEEVFDNPQDWPDLTTFEAIDTDNNTAALSLNLNHRDPVLRNIFQNKKFRIALSHALDRKAIIAKALDGKGKPFQVGPRPESPYYNDQLATQYLDYDPAKAKAILDEMGLKVGPDGIRLRPDGKPLSVFLDTVGEKRFEIIKAVAGYWRSVGIDVTARNLERSAFYDMRAVNQHDVSAWGGDGGIAVMLAPIYYFPYTYESLFATRWARWFQSPDDPAAEIPPTAVRRQMDLYHQLTEQGSAEKRKRMMREILQIAADEFMVIGVSLPPVRHGIYRKTMHNIPAVMPAAWSYPTPAPTNPAQYFIR
ncbi:ABC transporter substrate-binding protein [Aestuariispira ectoiniformans]|uniref:ABC transporter substrate-binding protein n=1 Tax=Aestuariispira ectoiniformans TaxID=2775080 RepID=UPI00223BD7FA|nr:ABC transporter substrate-binding protein [Aestuariispira ectoiniformans]